MIRYLYLQNSYFPQGFSEIGKGIFTHNVLELPMPSLRLFEMYVSENINGVRTYTEQYYVVIMMATLCRFKFW